MDLNDSTNAKALALSLYFHIILGKPIHCRVYKSVCTTFKNRGQKRIPPHYQKINP